MNKRSKKAHEGVAVQFIDAFRDYALLVDRSLWSSQAEHGLSFDCTELHEYSYTFFANLAKVLEEDMGVHVERLAPHLLKEIQVRSVRRGGAGGDFSRVRVGYRARRV